MNARHLPAWIATSLLAAGLSGCCSVHQPNVALEVPTEKQKAILPVYRIEPPDVILIEATDNVRRPDTPLQHGDQLSIHMSGWPVVDPTTDPSSDPSQYQAELQRELDLKLVGGTYVIAPDGTINLGPYYGSVAVGGLTLDSAKAKVREHLLKESGLVTAEVTVELINITGSQTVAGEHLVRQDGTVDLGIYGEVVVTGMTLSEAEAAIAAHLAAFLSRPRVNVDVVAYNSKAYYVITDGGGYGEQVVRMPITGNETVLDAISNIEGLSQVSSKNIWVARPSYPGSGVAQIMPVRWEEIASEGVTDTNYQLYPGDRIYIKSDALIQTDNFLAKVISPIERVFGVIILGDQANEAVRFNQTNSLRGSGALVP